MNESPEWGGTALTHRDNAETGFNESDACILRYPSEQGGKNPEVITAADAECLCETVSSCVCVLFQMKYKEAGKKGATSSLYSTLPETLETQHAKEASQLLSQVLTH